MDPLLHKMDPFFGANTDSKLGRNQKGAHTQSRITQPNWLLNKTYLCVRLRVLEIGKFHAFKCCSIDTTKCFFSCLSISLDCVILTRISEFMMHSNKSSIEFFSLL